jgi:hypothetical protein
VCTTTVEQMGVEVNFHTILTCTVDLDERSFRALTSVLARYERNPDCLFGRQPEGE